MTPTKIGVLASALFLCVAAGCATDDPNTTGGASPFPSRPAEIDVRAVTPCSLLSDGQLAELGLQLSSPSTATVEGLPSPACNWVGPSTISYSVQIIPANAVVATGLPGAVVTQIGGFGAVRDTPESLSAGGPICQLTIDAAPGQTIRVQALTPTTDSAPPIDEICRRATDVASKVMTTVVATAAR